MLDMLLDFWARQGFLMMYSAPPDTLDQKVEDWLL